MNKYLVVLHGIPGEFIEADKFATAEGLLHFWRGDQMIATFISWIGVKQVSPISAVVTSTTSNPGGAAVTLAEKQ